MIKQKKLLLLGGLRYLIPVIEAAHKLGYYVITCDNIPDNIAHRYSDEYYNVNIVDKDAVLELSYKLGINGIMSFAVDPGVITAAYVQERMGLPGNPYESVCILQNKDRFRNFLAEHGFNVPKAKGFSSIQEAMEEEEYTWPVIVKPVDAAGSKGVTRVDGVTGLKSALECAFEYSISKRVIIEEFIEKVGCSSDSECFSVKGKLQFVSFSAQRFDESAPNPYTPAAFSWPSTMTKSQEAELTSEVQRLLLLLGMQTSIYNVETRIGINGKAYIMEVSPRGGGNRLAEMIRHITGVDLITNAVRAAVGEDVFEVEQKDYQGYWVEVILHADKDGIFEDLETSSEIRTKIVELDLWRKKGEYISAFRGANNSIGTVVLKFTSKKEMQSFCTDIAGNIKIKIR